MECIWFWEHRDHLQSGGLYEGGLAVMFLSGQPGGITLVAKVLCQAWGRGARWMGSPIQGQAGCHRGPLLRAGYHSHVTDVSVPPPPQHGLSL